MISAPTKIHSSRSRGFTLIELLTVIAIIGILAAILIPTVSKVRAQARAVECVTQLRNWGQAIQVFANDFRGDIALSLSFAASEQNGVPFAGPGKLYDPYFGTARVAFAADKDGNTDAANFFSRCPEIRNSAAGIERRHYGFVIPREARDTSEFGSTYFGRTSISVKFYNLSKVPNPSRMFLMMEVAPGTGGIKTINGSDVATSLNTHVKPVADINHPDKTTVRHGGKANALFLDGHVKKYSWNQLNLATMPPGDRQTFQQMFNLN
jgi:prepilin-type N-terminal cleavage/methylation domain-containing protein/prepilin-type processing-associated H-X9-DG protein